MSWTEPIAVMAEVAANLDPSIDFITVTDAEDLMKQRSSEREQVADDIRNKLRALSRQLELARESATRPHTLPSEIEHATAIQDMDQNQISLGKAINEAQDLLRHKEAELVRLRAEEQDLEERDEAAAHDLDSTALRLEIIRGLGFEPILGKGGEVAKVLVRAYQSFQNALEILTVV
ncbi:hypothetical protein SISNIDRAFT_6029 [Sistotremastrum niveocremeum HHB9708]|uniref:Kinetochore protein Spc24 n=1 Tax=Sistotremastrum niveocremeum HHB9708 TaxID=1314777 RepID=A0A165AGF1_9AGAM|nr:hypothetical protein SISNIDRAFT_6029 [Sistotremastrum niveocremeum HHB9708]